MALDKGIVYYSDNHGDELLLSKCRKQLKKSADLNGIDEIICVSQKPINDFGINFVMDLKRSTNSIFKQVLKGLQESTKDIIFLCEQDIVYHPDHFKLMPDDDKIFYYDQNRWAVDDVTGKCVFYRSSQVSLLVAKRNLLLKHYNVCVENIEKDKWRNRYGYSPPKGHPGKRVGKAVAVMADSPSLDIRREDSWTRKRMTKDQFRNESSCRGWKESGFISPWGQLEGRFNEFINEL